MVERLYSNSIPRGAERSLADNGADLGLQLRRFAQTPLARLLATEAGTPEARQRLQQLQCDHNPRALRQMALDLPGAPLPDEDIACFGKLTAEQLHTQSFAVGFPSIAGTTGSFFMCHFLWRFKTLKN